MPKIGRPANYKTTKELMDAIEAYFIYLDKAKEFPTVTGLTLFLGFSNKQSLHDYRKKPEFSTPLQIALTYIEHAHEQGLFTGRCLGNIFALKNFGWHDRQEINHSVNKTLTEEEISEQLSELNRLKELTS